MRTINLRNIIARHIVALVRFTAIAFILASLVAAQRLLAATTNDNLFPPSPAAASAINFDGRGFIIKGQRTFILSGSVHYARVPREDWRDILLKVKHAGFNTVETYVFWNYHEPREGEFDFTTDSRDLGAFLDTARDVGLYAIVRVGPYSCGEWMNGGFPTWLLMKRGVELRRNNPVFLHAVDAWFDKLLPIIATRQIHRGGNVILVQLENEYPTDHWQHWGTDVDGPYMRHLLDLAHENGLEVPMFFSGLHHGHDPAPNTPINSSNRRSPWMSTELWTTWFDRYGVSGLDMLNDERHAWRVLAQGGNGFNLYMFYGGTTFGFFNFDDNQKFGDKREKGAASYDYGTLLGQTGDVRPLYGHLKRLGLFAQSFSSILAASDDATNRYGNFAQGVVVTARSAPYGTLVFLDNSMNATRTVALQDGWYVKLAPREIAAFALNIRLSPEAAIAQADTRILGIVPQGNLQTIICYGDAFESGRITFRSDLTPQAKTSHDAGFRPNAGKDPSIEFTYPSSGVGEESVVFGTCRLRILVMSNETADQTWIVDTQSGKRVVVGAPYLGEVNSDASGKLTASVDYGLNDPQPTHLITYGPGESTVAALAQGAPEISPTVPNFDGWRMAPDDQPLSAGFDDAGWSALPDGSPAQMGFDGDTSPYAWYRARFDTVTRTQLLKFARIGDRATFFVDGKMAGRFDLEKDRTPQFNVNIAPGQHELEAFVSYSGRTKFAGYTGPFNRLGWEKGLRGPVMADPGNQPVLNWKMRSGVDPFDPKLTWTEIEPTNGAPAYFRSHFRFDAAPDKGMVYRLTTKGLSSGNIWLNGHNIGVFPEIIKGCPGLWLPSCWMTAGQNTLIVLDAQGESPFGVRMQIESAASRHTATFSLH